MPLPRSAGRSAASDSSGCLCDAVKRLSRGGLIPGAFVCSIELGYGTSCRACLPVGRSRRSSRRDQAGHGTGTKGAGPPTLPARPQPCVIANNTLTVGIESRQPPARFHPARRRQGHSSTSTAAACVIHLGGTRSGVPGGSSITDIGHRHPRRASTCSPDPDWHSEAIMQRQRRRTVLRWPV